MTMTQTLMYCASAGYVACLSTVLGAVTGFVAAWVRRITRKDQ